MNAYILGDRCVCNTRSAGLELVAFQVSVTRDRASGLHVRCEVGRLPQTPGSLLGKLSSPILPGGKYSVHPEMTACRALVGEQKAHRKQLFREDCQEPRFFSPGITYPTQCI